VNFGFRRTVPHILGISAGVVVLMLCVGLGLGAAFRHIPVLYTVLEAASIAYLLYLAWKIGTSGELKVKRGEHRPMRFHEAIAFQWINPKAWMMVLTAATTIRLTADFNLNAVVMAAMFYVIGLPCICVWAAFGTGVRRFLSNSRRLRAFNLAMALSLVVSMYPLFAHLISR
jgi:threonine/homoserine/homoserine lactone efflux protein